MLRLYGYTGSMKIRYETGVATLVQLVVLVLLNFVNTVISIFQGCSGSTGDCVSGILLSFIYFLLVAGWFSFLAVLGYAAQDKRSKRLSQVLLGAELFVALIALFDLKHYPNIMGLIISLTDLVLALWIATIAFRLMRSGGGRIPTKQRAKRRRKITKK